MLSREVEIPSVPPISARVTDLVMALLMTVFSIPPPMERGSKNSQQNRQVRGERPTYQTEQHQPHAGDDDGVFLKTFGDQTHAHALDQNGEHPHVSQYISSRLGGEV